MVWLMDIVALTEDLRESTRTMDRVGVGWALMLLSGLVALAGSAILFALVAVLHLAFGVDQTTALIWYERVVMDTVGITGFQLAAAWAIFTLLDIGLAAALGRPSATSLTSLLVSETLHWLRWLMALVWRALAASKPLALRLTVSADRLATLVTTRTRRIPVPASWAASTHPALA